MEEYGNIYDKIREILGHEPDSFNILEEQIDMDLQMEYFEFSRNLPPQQDPYELEKADVILYNAETSIERKKEFLARLAVSDEIEAYRIIERYVKSGDPDLHDWAVLAMLECRMQIESRLLDENKVFISTGLGGKGHKLRYFIVLLLKPENKMTPLREKIIRMEVDTVFSQIHAELESIRFTPEFITMVAMIPLDITLGEVFEQIIGECNFYGNFLQKDFIVTNIKLLSDSEIQSIIRDRNDIIMD